MQSYLSVVNLSSNAAVSVFCDDYELFREIYRSYASPPRRCPAGSVRITVYDASDRLIFDLWLPFSSNTHHTLFIYDGFYKFS